MDPHILVPFLCQSDVLLQPAVLLLEGIQAAPGLLPQLRHLEDQAAKGHAYFPHGLNLKVQKQSGDEGGGRVAV